MGVLSELRRRNVFRMAALYVVAAWLIMQVTNVLIDLGNLPDRLGPIIIALLAVGFPIALILSWFYQITPEGPGSKEDIDRSETVTPVSGRWLDFVAISVLCAAVLLFAYDKWWTPRPPEKSVAVLPFVNMSGDPGQDYFSDGISEEMLNLLAQLPDVYVPARSSSFYFKGKNEHIADIAAALRVSHVLEGSVRRSGDRIRVTAQLIKAEDGYHVWSNSYDREFDDVFAVQDEIAAAITDALEVRLTSGRGESRLKSSRADVTEAYDLYLRARELMHLRARPYLEEAIGHLEHSLRLDDGFAPAHAQLAIALMLLEQTNAPITQKEAIEKATPHLMLAQALEPGLAEAHGGRALLALVANDPASTVPHARKALAANPSYSDAMNWLQVALGELGRYAESDATLEQLLVIDPLSFIGRWNYAEVLNAAGRMSEAHDLAEAVAKQSRFWGFAIHAETALFYEGDIGQALYWGLKMAAETDGDSPAVKVAFNMVGEFDEARRILDKPNFWIDAFAEGLWQEAIRVTGQNLARDPRNREVVADAVEIRYYAGRIDEALPLLERLTQFVPEGRPLPGFRPLLQTMRLALARRRAGDEEGAQAAARIAGRDHAARLAAGDKNQFLDLAAAAIAAFEGDTARAVASLKSSMEHGLRDRWTLEDAIFDEIRDAPEFVAVREELHAILAEEHRKVLQLICFHNPTPDNWQPLPRTCDGVEKSEEGFVLVESYSKP